MHNLSTIKELLKNYRNEILGEEFLFKNAVLLPLVYFDGKLSLIFEKRATSVRQGGEISFPGGHWENDDHDEWMTALRETSEELGISPQEIEYVGKLAVLVTHSQLLIYPFIGFIKDFSLIKPEQREVEEIITIPLKDLLQLEVKYYEAEIATIPPVNFPYHLIPQGEKYPWRQGKIPIYFYLYQNYVIWGITARILHHFLKLIK